eukprot:353794-Chlamydomonas_euryale.AAC.11
MRTQTVSPTRTSSAETRPSSPSPSGLYSWASPTSALGSSLTPKNPGSTDTESAVTRSTRACTQADRLRAARRQTAPGQRQLPYQALVIDPRSAGGRVSLCGRCGCRGRRPFHVRRLPRKRPVWPLRRRRLTRQDRRQRAVRIYLRRHQLLQPL